MPKQLLFVVNNPDFFASHRLAIAVEAMERGYEVSLAAPRRAVVPELEKLGLRFHEIPLARSSTNPLEELETLRAIRRVVRRVRPDVLHLVTLKAVVYGGIVGRVERVPLVVSAVSGLGYTFIAEGAKARARRLAMLSVLRLAVGRRRQRVIFQNPDDRDVFLHNGLIRAEQVRMIKGSGTELSLFDHDRWKKGPTTVLLPARMLWDKGVGEFVDAARILKSRGVGVRFVLSGDPDEGNPASVSTEQLVAWHEEGVVEWLGHTDNIAGRLAESHIVVLPSYREGFPKSLIDAAAAGRAIVTTDVPGCRDAVEQGRSGLLVAPKDAVSLANTLERLIDDEAQQRRLGAAARILAEQEYAIEKIVDQHLAIYDEAFR